MKRGLSASYRFPQKYNMSNTARLTNSMNSTYLKTFNQWGGVSYADILSNYPQEMIDACWDNLSRFILENYQAGKGTMIKGFGTFTFTNVEYSLEGTTNQFDRDLKKRKPVFIVSNEFVEYLKPGMYNEKSGLLYYTQKLNNSVPIVKVNYSKISYGINISKEECFTIISTTFKLMGDQIRRGLYEPKFMEDLGELVLRGHIFGMRFCPNLFKNLSLKTHNLIHTKKNLRLYMETKDSEGIRHLNIEDVDRAERDIRPKKAVLTKITKTGDEWLQNNLGIDVKNDIRDEPRDDLFLRNKAIDKKEFYVDQRDYRNYPLQNLYGLNIPQDILEGIYNNKYLLMRNLRKIDRHGDGLIPKYDFINCFKDTNCHHLLRTELIEKITDAYINNDPDVIMIHYKNLVNALCKDIKNIIDNEYRNFPIEKYRYTIPKNNQRARSAYAYSKDTGNLKNEALSSLKTYRDLYDINELDIRDDIDKINRLSQFLLKENKNKNNKMISYLGLISMLKKHKINIDKVQMIKILKFLEIQNPNAFYLNEILTKINSHFMNSTNYKTFGGIKKNKNNLKNKKNNKRYNKPKNNIDEDFIINAIEIIKQRIFENSSEIDEISKYFDHLLSYNICRRANIIFPDELERLFQLEEYNFTPEEINLIFNYMDTNKDGFIDRIEFINTFRIIPHPIMTIYDFIKRNNLSIGDLAYKMGVDLYNINEYSEISNSIIDRLNFRVKMKLLNNNFEPEFIESLFSYIGPSGVSKVITLDELLNFFRNSPNLRNYNDDSYKRLYQIKKKALDNCRKILPKCVKFDVIKNRCLDLDPNVTEKIPMIDFFNIFHYYLNGRLSDEDLIHVLRANRYIDENEYVNYHKFLLLIYLNHVEDKFDRCLQEFEKFLHEECGDDLFIFMVKINNIPNDSNIRKAINMQRLYEFFRQRISMLDFNTIHRFDYDGDGIITMEDLKNIIINYIDKNYFNKGAKDVYNNYNFEENKKIFINIKEALNKLNMTENNLFYYLDNNKDGYIDIYEFRNQIFKLPLNRRYTQKQIDLFYTFLDEFNNGKVDINTFQNKLRIIKDYINSHNEKGYKGNYIMETLILDEFYKFFQKNNRLSDTEIFSILDQDHDGIISINDMMNFCTKNLLISPHELDDNIIIRFIEAISLNRNRNLTLADLQNLLRAFTNNELESIRNHIINYCNETENMNMNNEDNKNWLNNILDKIGMFINEEYENDIQSFYNDYNVTDFRNKGQGLSFDNFVNFIKRNYLLFEPYHINNNQSQQKTLFNYISNNKKYITKQDLENLFGYNNGNNGNENIYDFYEKMHNDITIFLHENFHNCEDAFKYFHNEIYNNNYKSDDNLFIKKKEFFNGISNLFPQKYDTNTIQNYFNKYFGNKNKITYSDFNYIYYNNIDSNDKYKKSLDRPAKLKTSRPDVSNIPFTSYKSPFPTERNQKLKTPFDLDPLYKLKRLILSSKIDFRTECENLINYSQPNNGQINQFEFKNFIKRLNLGLTNIEIEDIISKSGVTYNGFINIYEFYKYITDTELNLSISDKNIIENLKQLKQYIYKYYNSPRFAFEMNDRDKKGYLDFEQFKRIMYELYYKERIPVPNYPVMKCVYDYVDVRKDGIIDLNEWNRVFAITESNLDVIKGPKSEYIRDWEGSEEIDEVYKLISKNKKIIKDKVKLYTIRTSSDLFIQENHLIDILINVLGRIRISYPQWKMIVGLGDTQRNGVIDFNAFIKAIDSYTKVKNSHPKSSIKKY